MKVVIHWVKVAGNAAVLFLSRKSATVMRTAFDAIKRQRECRIVANTSAFQAEDAGSIPVIPSTFLKPVALNQGRRFFLRDPCGVCDALCGGGRGGTCWGVGGVLIAWLDFLFYVF